MTNITDGYFVTERSLVVILECCQTLFRFVYMMFMIVISWLWWWSLIAMQYASSVVSRWTISQSS